MAMGFFAPKGTEMKRKAAKQLIRTLWPSRTDKHGTVFEQMTPEIFVDLWFALKEADAEEAMVKARMEDVD